MNRELMEMDFEMTTHDEAGGGERIRAAAQLSKNFRDLKSYMEGTEKVAFTHHELAKLYPMLQNEFQLLDAILK